MVKISTETGVCDVRLVYSPVSTSVFIGIVRVLVIHLRGEWLIITLKLGAGSVWVRVVIRKHYHKCSVREEEAGRSTDKKSAVTVGCC